MSQPGYRRIATLVIAACLLVPGIPGHISAADRDSFDIFPGATEVIGDMANYTGTLNANHNADVYKMMLNRTPSYIDRVEGWLEKTSSGGEVRIYLYDDLGYRLAWNGTTGSGKVYASAGAPRTGYVYLAVFLWPGSASSDYALNVTKQNLTADPALMDDDNAPSEAVAVTNGYLNRTHLDALYDVSDFYSVDLGVLPSSKDILSVLLVVPPQGDLMVELYLAGNSSNPYFSDQGEIYEPDYGENETLYFVPQAAGQYVIRIWAEHGGGDYELRVRVFRGWADSNNEADNGTIVTDDPVLEGNLSLDFDSSDYFRMYLQSDTTLNLSLAVLAFDGDFKMPWISLWLMDPDRKLVNSSTSADPLKSVGYLVTTTGWHYFKLKAERESAGDYVLNISTIRPPEVLQPQVEVVLDEDTNASVDLATVFRDAAKRPMLFNFTPVEHLNITLAGHNLTIVPARDWNGHTQFSVSARNQERKLSTAIIDVGVRPVDDPPVALQANMTFNSQEDETVILPVSVFALFNDVDGDNLTYSAAGNAHTNVTIDENGTVTMVPVPYWWGIETFRLVATDPFNETAFVRITLNIQPVNHPPQVVQDPGPVGFHEDTCATVDLNQVFWDPDGDLLSFSASGGLFLGVGIQNGVATVRLQYAIWPSDWNGNETLTFTATDPSNTSTGLDVAFNVIPVNAPPYVWRALPNQSMLEDMTVTMLNLNNYFRDPHGDALTFTVNGTSNVAVSISPDGNVTFAPAANWSGTETMVFSASDSAHLTATLRFTLTVEPVDEAPELRLASVSPTKGDASTLFTFTIVCRDIDSASADVRLVIGRKSLPMERVTGDLQRGALYRVRTALPEGKTTYYFEADDGASRTDTATLELNVGAAPFDNTLLYIGMGSLIIVLMALAMAFAPPRKRRWEERDEEE